MVHPAKQQKAEQSRRAPAKAHGTSSQQTPSRAAEQRIQQQQPIDSHSVSSSFDFLAGFVAGRPLFFLSGVCVCCLVMMIKHAGRKYSIPTKPKKASKQESRQKRRRQAARYRFPGKTSTATALLTTTLLKFRPLHSSYSKLVYFFLYSS